MPVVSFSLKHLERFTDLTPKQLESLAFDYGIEAEIKEDTIEVEVTAERPDLLSAEGFTRAMNTFTSREIRSVPSKLPESGLVITVAKDVRKLRPYIGALVAENVRIDSVGLRELISFQDKVCQTFGRQRKKIAVGVYDLSKIEGNINYSIESKHSVSLIPLNSQEEMTAQQILTEHPVGIKYADALPDGEYIPVLRDESGQILSIPPIINAHGVGKVTPEASRLFVDVTGTSERAVKEMLNIIAHNFLDIGAQVKTVTTEYPENSVVSPSLELTRLPYSLENINKVIGTNISELELQKFLQKMDLLVDDRQFVGIPSYRTDIIGEVDIAGDLLIAIGLDNLKPNFGNIKKERGKSNSIKDFTFQLSDIAKRVGLTEIKSLILTDPERLDLFSGNYIQTGNAKSRTFSAVRTSLQPGIIEVLAQNITAPKPINVYEVGETLHLSQEGDVYETISWGFASLGSQASFTIAKSYIQTILKALDITYDLTECNEERYIVGRSAFINVQGIKIGHFGEIHPRILDHFSFPEPICSGEIDCQLIKHN
jgi:phenylalanyl-tRNA synthetase beta chain